MLNCSLLRALIDHKYITMKKQVICYIFMFSCVGVLAQDDLAKKKIDSLYYHIKKTKDDTLKINLYEKIWYLTGSISTDKAWQYNDTIFTLSKKLNYEKGFAFCDFNRATLLGNTNPKEAIILAKKAKMFFKNKNDTYYYLRTVMSLSYAYMVDNQNNNVVAEIEKNLDIATKSKDISVIGSLHYYLGYSYNIIERNDKALYHLKKAFMYAELEDNDESKYAVYLAIAGIYKDLLQYEKALYYLNLSAKLKISDFSIHSMQLSKTELYIAMHLFDKSLLVAQDDYKFFKAYPKTIFANVSVLNLAKCYLCLEKYTIAIDYLKQLEIFTVDPSLTVEVYLYLSKCYLKSKQLDKSKFYIDKAFFLFDQAQTNIIRKDIFLVKYEVEKLKGNYQNALLFHEKYNALTEKMSSRINKDRILELQTDFEVTEKESKIKSIQVASLQKSNQIDKQRRYLTYGGIGLVLALLGILVFIKVYRAIKKKNTIIGGNNIALQSSIIEKEILLKEIHHRVKNNLQLVMSLLNIQSQEVDNTMADFLIVSQSRIISMSLIHESLYQTENLSKVDFKAYVTKLTEAIVASQNNLHTDVQLKIEMDAIYFDIQTAIPLGLIINELVNNAYKHAFKQQQKGLITLVLKQTEDSYELLVCDDGAGVSVELTAKKTLGMELVQQLVLQIKGVLHIQNDLGLSYNIIFENQTISYEK
jgi:two-component system, sensor histidine kinase PdtaS